MLIKNLESLAGVHTHTHTHTHTSSVKRRGLTHNFSWIKIRSPNIEVWEDNHVQL